MKILMKLTVVLLSVAAFVLIIGSFLPEASEPFYKSIFFLLPVVVLFAVQIICIIRYKFSLKKIGFYLCHIGLCVIILSAFFSMFSFRDVTFNIPVNSASSFDNVSKSDGTVVDFGFKISLPDLKTAYYNAEYTVYKYLPEQQAYELYLDTVSVNRSGNYVFGGGYKSLSKGDAMDENGFKETIKTEDGLMLKRKEQVAKMYSASLALTGEKTQMRNLAVNAPVSANGWKFYFMDYDREEETYVTIYAKQDSGNLSMHIGIWIMIFGTALLCFNNLAARRGQNG